MNDRRTPRPHRRAVGQLLLGLVPLLTVAVVLLVVLTLRLPVAQAPLAEASATAVATVTGSGESPDGRGLTVTFPDAQGEERTGLLVLRRVADVPAGSTLTVQYDPDAPGGPDPEPVYADGDAAHGTVGDIVFGMLVVTLVAVAAAALTAARVASRRGLRRRAATGVSATHVVVRRGLLVRSWLELATAAGPRWLPVHWSRELAALPPDSRIEVLGDPARQRLVLPVVAGAEVWPSGRLQDRQPRGTLTEAEPAADAPAGLARQARGDAVLILLAPVLGLLWAYVDGSGPAGFAVATALCAAVLFWLPQHLGSAP